MYSIENLQSSNILHNIFYDILRVVRTRSFNR